MNAGSNENKLWLLLTKESINLLTLIISSSLYVVFSTQIFLTNWFQFKGTVKGFDNYVVILDCEGKQNLVYKHAISTIVPNKPVNFFDDVDINYT